MSETATYEANNVDELKAEIDRRGLDRTGKTAKGDLIKVLEDSDGGKGSAKAPAASDSDLVPTESGDPPRLTGDAVVEVERSDTRGVALGDIPLLDPRSTVGSAPKIPEGFESAAASARGERAEQLANTLGEHGMEDVEDALAARRELADATGGEVLVEASGPVAVATKDDDDDDDTDDD